MAKRNGDAFARLAGRSDHRGGRREGRRGATISAGHPRDRRSAVNDLAVAGLAFAGSGADSLHLLLVDLGEDGENLLRALLVAAEAIGLAQVRVDSGVPRLLLTGQLQAGDGVAPLVLEQVEFRQRYEGGGIRRPFGQGLFESAAGFCKPWVTGGHASADENLTHKAQEQKAGLAFVNALAAGSQRLGDVAGKKTLVRSGHIADALATGELDGLVKGTTRLLRGVYKGEKHTALVVEACRARQLSQPQLDGLQPQVVIRVGIAGVG